MSSVDHDPGATHRQFLFQFGLLWPALLAGCALLLHGSGLDDALTRLFYDAKAHAFVVGGSGPAEFIGHRLARGALVAIWLLLVAAALASWWVQGLVRHRGVLWATVLAMALGPVLVTLLKDINTRACPWNLKDYGGMVDYSDLWFVPRALAGRCFPGGHAAGGFSLVALAFAGQAANHRGLRRAGLWLGFGAGAAFSLLRLAQGAHFMSHNLWSAVIDLCMAALCFAPLLLPRAVAARPVGVVGTRYAP
jgi:membrane-associated PAP2 superfamily phosphatase